MIGDDDDQSNEPDDLFPTEQPTVDAGNLQAVRKQRTRSRLQTKQSAAFWQRIFGTEVGRRELWRVLESAGTFQTPFACGPTGFPQPEATWFRAGQQELGLRLFFSWQRLDPGGVLLMQQEHDPRFVRLAAIPTKKG